MVHIYNRMTILKRSWSMKCDISFYFFNNIFYRIKHTNYVLNIKLCYQTNNKNALCIITFLLNNCWFCLKKLLKFHTTSFYQFVYNTSMISYIYQKLYLFSIIIHLLSIHDWSIKFLWFVEFITFMYIRYSTFHFFKRNKLNWNWIKTKNAKTW